MPKTTLTTPVCLPKVWQALLDIKSFDDLPEYPTKYRMGDTPADHTFDPTPFRDDARTISVQDGDFLVTYALVSGNGNYWLASDILQKSDGAEDFCDAASVYESEPAFDLPQNPDECDGLGGEFVVPITLVDSPVAA